MNKSEMAKVRDRIGLGRQPDTDGAKALTEDVLAVIMPHLQASTGKRIAVDALPEWARTGAPDGPKATPRPIGPKSLAKWRHDLGNVLAGVMRPAGGAARVARGNASPMWDGELGSLGRDRFWRIAGALITAGLFGYAPGLKGGSDGDGTPALLWTTPALQELAAAHGVVPATRAADWRLPDAAAVPTRPIGLRVRPWKEVSPAPATAAREDRERMERELQALNDLNASVVIRGAGETVTLFRAFRHSLDFGGRFYGPAYINVPEEERAAITFDGEPAAEVDVSSAQLSLVCGLAGAVDASGSLPRADLYAVAGLPRAAAKAWTVRTFGRGTAAWEQRRWKPSDAPEVQAIPVRAVEAAMLAAYPFLSDLPALVPPGVLDGIPDALRCKAAGQWITRREADIIGAAMAYCVQHGVPVLPVHDSLIVPRSKADVARRALTGAYFALAGVTVRLKG